MHGKHAVKRQEVVERSKDGFLDLARITGAGNENRTRRQVQYDRRGWPGDGLARAVPVWVRMKLRCVEDGKVRLEIGQVGRVRADELIVGEQSGPRAFRDQSHV